MNAITNSNRRNSLVGLLIFMLGIAMIVLPRIFRIDGLRGGFAVSFFGTFVLFVGIITTFMFFRLARLEERILRKENILAHWTYSVEEWRNYAAEEHAADKKDKWRLFLLAVVISIIVSIVIWVIYPREVILTICIILGMIVYIGLTADFSKLAPYLWNKHTQGEAYVTKDGAFLDSRLLIWHGPGTRLMRATYEEGKQSLPELKIEYSSQNLTARNHYSARIPVPRGQEETARTIVARIQASNLKK